MTHRCCSRSRWRLWRTSLMQVSASLHPGLWRQLFLLVPRTKKTEQQGIAHPAAQVKRGRTADRGRLLEKFVTRLPLNLDPLLL